MSEVHLRLILRDGRLITIRASAQRVGSRRAGSSEGICERSEIYVPTWIGGGCARARASGDWQVASRIFARVRPGEAVVSAVKPTKSCATWITAEHNRNHRHAIARDSVLSQRILCPS